MVGWREQCTSFSPIWKYWKLSLNLKIAVFSDIHGNPYACQAVLQAITRQGPWDAILVAGDICLGGSDPGGCIDLLRAAGVMGVYGNTEVYIKSPEQVPPDELHRQRWDLIQPAVYWVRAQLSVTQLAWLEALPFELRFSPTGRKSDDLLVVHANPNDVELMIFPQEAEQKRLWGEVRQPDDDPALARALEGVAASVVAFGHYHRVYERRWRDLRLVNVASCSLNGIDNDYRARYTALAWRAGEWEIERCWVTYDVQKEIAALKSSDMPSKEMFLGYFN